MATKSIRLSDGTDTLLPESAVSRGHSDSQNGYLKCADGTLICWGKATIARGGDRIAFYFPVTYTVIPCVCLNALESGNGGGVLLIPWSVTTSSCYALLRNGSISASDQLFFWIAIGRWK